jgi:TRAP-type uncharacterized transport system fused permease subunit
MKLAFIGLFVPYVFIFNTSLLEFPNVSAMQLLSVGATLLGLVGLSAAWWGWFIKPLRWSARGLTALLGAACLAWAAIPP